MVGEASGGESGVGEAAESCWGECGSSGPARLGGMRVWFRAGRAVQASTRHQADERDPRVTEELKGSVAPGRSTKLASAARPAAPSLPHSTHAARRTRAAHSVRQLRCARVPAVDVAGVHVNNGKEPGTRGRGCQTRLLAAVRAAQCAFPEGPAASAQGRARARWRE
jgi:hypothetical protein